MIIKNEKQLSNQIINLKTISVISYFDNDPYHTITFTMSSGKEITWRYDSDKARRDADLQEILSKLQ